MGFDVTVLGCAGTYCGPGRACSSYLLRADGTHVLVDCGNGSSANLQRYLPFEALDAILITHRHVDHWVDLVGMFYALRFGAPPGPRVTLYGGPDVHSTLDGILATDSSMSFDEAFDRSPVAPGDRLEVGPLTIDLHPSVHTVPTVSVRVGYEDRTFTYSSDSAGGPALVECARNADLFLCEATWQGDAADQPEGLHLTAAGAAEVANRAEVGQLVLTHLLARNDAERTFEEASGRWSGPLAIAEDNTVWKIA